MLAEKILAAEVQMKAKLAEARATFSHRGIKGDHVEIAFRSFLQQCLPRRLSVGHGEVVDRHESHSTQTDVIIASEHHPFTFTSDSPGLFFLEGVSAAGEVKSLLTSNHLRDTIENSKKWKQFRIEPGRGTIICDNPENANRFYRCPPYFLFAMESQLSLETIYDRLVAEGSFVPDREGNCLDGVFLLDRGCIIDFGNGKESFQFRLPDGAILPGWQWRQSKNVLFDFLGWLSACMPRMLRFEQILTSYLVGNYQPDKTADSAVTVSG